ncbi:MAG: PepSY-associated TM helix domain-containing protein [Acidimicrobiales bacterium]
MSPYDDTTASTRPDDTADTLDPADPLDPTEPAATSPIRGTRRSVRTQRWMRWLHVYTSMISLLLVLFFGLTGITLNHPSWTLGDAPDSTSTTGTLPAELLTADGGDVDYLGVSEYARDTLGAHGSIGDYGTSGTSGEITYQAAGYAATLLFDTTTGEYTFDVEQQGWVGVLNDLHKGRDTTSSWKWVIDLSGVFLVVVALTGLVIQFVYRKRRRSALALAAAFTVVGVVLMLIGRG